MATEEELRTRLAEATRRGNRRAEATIRFGLADLARRRGDFATARGEYEQAADLFRSESASKELSTTLNNLGLTSIAQNDFEGARHAFDEAIELSSRAG